MIIDHTLSISKRLVFNLFSISKKIEHALDTHRPGTLCASCGALQLNLSCNRIGEKDNVALAWFTNYK